MWTAHKSSFRHQITILLRSIEVCADEVQVSAHAWREAGRRRQSRMEKKEEKGLKHRHMGPVVKVVSANLFTGTTSKAHPNGSGVL